MAEEQQQHHESDDEWGDQDERNNNGRAEWVLGHQLDPKAGDLIEFKRGLYCHWGLYVGQGYIIHVDAEGKDMKEAYIRKQKLVDIAERGKPNNKCRVNNLLGEAKQFMDEMCYSSVVLPNTGFLQVFINVAVSWYTRKQINPIWKPRNAQSCIREAEKLVDQIVPYDFLGKNCEYYATKWKYRYGFTDQVDKLTSAYPKAIGAQHKRAYY